MGRRKKIVRSGKVIVIRRFDGLEYRFLESGKKNKLKAKAKRLKKEGKIEHYRIVRGLGTWELFVF